MSAPQNGSFVFCFEIGLVARRLNQLNFGWLLATNALPSAVVSSINEDTEQGISIIVVQLSERQLPTYDSLLRVLKHGNADLTYVYDRPLYVEADVHGVTHHHDIETWGSRAMSKEESRHATVKQPNSKEQSKNG